MFDLSTDPGELCDLASDPEFGGEVKKWRKRLVDFLAERGPAWVRNGNLVPRTEKILYSPNYPQHAK